METKEKQDNAALFVGIFVLAVMIFVFGLNSAFTNNPFNQKEVQLSASASYAKVETTMTWSGQPEQKEYYYANHDATPTPNLEQYRRPFRNDVWVNWYGVKLE